MYLFVTAVHGGVLGALLTVSPRVWYAAYLSHHPAGLTPLEDQQLAGLLMWVPAGLYFAAGALFLFAAWLRQSDRVSRVKAGPVVYVLLLLLVVSCNRHSDLPGGGRGPEQANVPGAVPNMRVVADVSSGEWRMPAGDYGNLRYSTLDTINTANVMNLHVVTTFSTGVPHGHEGQPLVFGNTMYVVTPFPNNLIAVDLTTPGGAVKWIYEPHPDLRLADLERRQPSAEGFQVEGDARTDSRHGRVITARKVRPPHQFRHDPRRRTPEVAWARLCYPIAAMHVDRAAEDVPVA